MIDIFKNYTYGYSFIWDQTVSGVLFQTYQKDMRGIFGVATRGIFANERNIVRGNYLQQEEFCLLTYISKRI